MSSDQIVIHPKSVVAVVGAGPAGLACAAHLLRRGLEPVVFETAAAVGGQWNGEAPGCATWPGMRTNTSRVMTAFADLDHRAGTATYPTREEMFAYLRRYADAMAVSPRIRFRTRVDEIARAADGWRVTSTQEGRTRREVYARVVVASGRHGVPVVPQVPGLETFAGALGIAHTSAYDGEARLRGATVVVAGCSISALEIASALAYGGARRVIVSRRRQRWVLPKLIAGVPTEHLLFNRAAALASERLPPEALAAGLKAAILRAGADPAPHGAGAADPDVFAAGITQSQNFLPAVAEGRIETRPWIASVDGRVVRFSDGDTIEADALLFGTGYRPSLPFFADDVARTLRLDEGEPDLADHTFHPDLPGLAFVGLYDLVGPYLPVLELQARWVAYTFAGVRPIPSDAELRDGLARGRALRAMGPPPMHALAVLFARRAGVEPDPRRWPELERTLLFGPLSPASFRLVGPDARADAPARTAEAGRAFGRDGGGTFSSEEIALRDLVFTEPAATAA
jgi:cation diffusion facilitator CzcD-associated flavoprotein CzcO